MSQSCCLAVVASFVFLRIPLGLKFFFGAVVTITFAYFMQDFSDSFLVRIIRKNHTKTALHGIVWFIRTFIHYVIIF